MTSDQLKKLPVWAQNEIKRLQKEVDYYKEMVNQINGETETNTFIRHLMDVKPLPSNSDVEFHLGGDKLSVRVKDGKIVLHSNAHRDMFIRPCSSNLVHIHFQ